MVVKTFWEKNRLFFSRSLFKYEKASWAWNVKLWSFRFGSLTAKGVWFFHPPGRVVTGIMDEGISQASSKCHTFPCSWEQVAVRCHFHHSHDGCKETVFSTFFVKHEKPTRKWRKPKKTVNSHVTESHPRFLAVHEFVDNLQLELLPFPIGIPFIPIIFSWILHDSTNLYVSCWFIAFSTTVISHLPSPPPPVGFWGLELAARPSILMLDEPTSGTGNEFRQEFVHDFHMGVSTWVFHMTGWWQLTYLDYFHPENWGRWTHFDEHIFQRGWNRQPVSHDFKWVVDFFQQG